MTTLRVISRDLCCQGRDGRRPVRTLQHGGYDMQGQLNPSKNFKNSTFKANGTPVPSNPARCTRKKGLRFRRSFLGHVI